jgi:hypothetical protein
LAVNKILTLERLFGWSLRIFFRDADGTKAGRVRTFDVVEFGVQCGNEARFHGSPNRFALEWPGNFESKFFLLQKTQQGRIMALRPVYKEAADALIDRILERDSGADLQVYPIVFLYRQYLELRLKELLISCGHVVYDESKLTHGHDLKGPWLQVRKILESVWPGTYPDEMDALGKCIDEFCLLDAKSMNFRYPIDKEGQPTLLGLERVDLVNLKNVMERISSFLDASSDGVGEILSNTPREDYS